MGFDIEGSRSSRQATAARRSIWLRLCTGSEGDIAMIIAKQIWGCQRNGILSALSAFLIVLFGLVDCAIAGGMMLVSDTDSRLALNAFGGAADGTVMTLVNNCTPDNTDCTWTYRHGMLVSDTDPTLSITADGGAAVGTVLKLSRDCTTDNVDCTWTHRKGMWLSDRNPALAVNAYGGAGNGTVLRLVNNCSSSNTDCTWTHRKAMWLSDTDVYLATNAYGGAANGTELKIVSNCPSDNTDCTWTYHKGMILSDRDPGLTMNAYGGAASGTVLKLVNNCAESLTDCTWTFQKGRLLSDTNLGLAINAYGGAASGTALKLVNNCAENLTDCTWTYSGTLAPPLKGWVDMHTHPLSNLAFGGKLIYGGVDVGALLPSDPFCKPLVRASSEDQALGPENSVHGPNVPLDFGNPCGDTLRYEVIQQLEQQLGAVIWPGSTYKSSGYPNFISWPAWDDLVNQKMWVEWIRRSYQGGQRVIVALAVNNKLLGNMTAGPGDLPTDDQSSADLQITEIKSFVGRHPDFMQVAYSATDLYNIVSRNKLAVVIGVEIDHIGNLSGNVPALSMMGEVDRLYGEGVRYIFPVHLVDNPIGGAAAYEDLFNVANVYENGSGYVLGCADLASKISYNYTPPSTLTTLLASSKLGANTPGIPPPVSCPNGVVNTRSLTSAGILAIGEMMKKGMLIDIDHMSQASANAAITLAQARPGGYPLNSGHNGVRGALGGVTTERSFTSQQYGLIGAMHGMAGVGSAQIPADRWLALYNAVIQAMGPGAAAGLGTDMNGMEFAMPPRLGSSVKYGTKAFPLPMSKDGTKTWDYNVLGVAHYGLLPDFLQDVASLQGGTEAIKNLNKGAQYFYETWRMSEQAR
jgi:hypothetical protein